MRAGGAPTGERTPRVEIEPRHLTIERRVRYAVLEGRAGEVTQVWFVLHGYNQLAHRFLRAFEAIDDGTRRIVAPEGLHRQYIDHAARTVGASWMTSEDRLTDIEDYVAYLDGLYGATFTEAGLDSGNTEVVGLGFSQGVHTLCRWVAFGGARIDRAVLWGATVPPDLDLETHGSALAAADLHVVFGDDDEYYGADAVRAHETRLNAAGVPFTALGFEGGHRIDAPTLGRLTDIGPPAP